MSMRPLREREPSAAWSTARIGAAVRVHRVNLELSRTDLAERLEVPVETVIAIEDGEYDPRLALAPRLEAALDLAPGSIAAAGRSAA